MLIFENIREGTNFKKQGKAKEKECNSEKDGFEVFVFFPAYFECSCFSSWSISLKIWAKVRSSVARKNFPWEVSAMLRSVLSSTGSRLG